MTHWPLSSTWRFNGAAVVHRGRSDEREDPKLVERGFNGAAVVHRGR